MLLVEAIKLLQTVVGQFPLFFTFFLDFFKLKNKFPVFLISKYFSPTNLLLRNARNGLDRLLLLLNSVLDVLDGLQSLSKVVLQFVIVLLRLGKVVLQFFHLVSQFSCLSLLASHHVLVFSYLEAKGVVFFMELRVHGLESHVLSLQFDVGLTNRLV
jgi:hypothetical protein